MYVSNAEWDFKKPGDAELKDFVSVDLAENVGASVNALSANFVDFDALDEEPQAKAVKPLNAFDVLMKAVSTKILLPEIGSEEQANPTQWVELHNRLLQLAKIPIPWCRFSSCRGEIFRCVSILECWFFLF